MNDTRTIEARNIPLNNLGFRVFFRVGGLSGFRVGSVAEPSEWATAVFTLYPSVDGLGYDTTSALGTITGSGKLNTNGSLDPGGVEWVAAVITTAESSAIKGSLRLSGRAPAGSGVGAVERIEY